MRDWMVSSASAMPRSNSGASCAARAFFCVLAFFLDACATQDQERNLAPIFSEYSTAGGGVESEGLGGILKIRTSRPRGPWTQWSFRPFVTQERELSGETTSRFLVPFGQSRERGDDYLWQLVPITRYDRRVTSDGQLEWTLLTLPGIYWSRRADGRILRAWFPFAGVTESFLSYDRLEFVLFPLWMRTERGGRVTNHFLWPLISITTGTGGPSWSVIPFYSESVYEGRYDRRVWIWPFFSLHKNHLNLPPEKRETLWMFWPFYGHTTRGTYSANTVVWPFFGWSTDRSTGFWTLDAPWPLVEFMRSPKEDIERTRVWPFYSHYHGDGLDSTWYMWPLVNVRRELYEKSEKNSVYLIPFWQSWKRVDEDAGVFEYQKLWPLYVREGREQSERHFAFPALNPLWRTPEIDDMYAWIWELYTRDVDQDMVRERSWLGLYRREKDAAEDRRSFSFLWAHRSYRENGSRIHETSLLFGLIRWRSTDDDAFDWLGPAIPGPGWPLERVSASGTVSAGPDR
jgi:hypothetical protein